MCCCHPAATETSRERWGEVVAATGRTTESGPFRGAGSSRRRTPSCARSRRAWWRVITRTAAPTVTIAYGTTCSPGGPLSHARMTRTFYRSRRLSRRGMPMSGGNGESGRVRMGLRVFPSRHGAGLTRLRRSGRFLEVGCSATTWSRGADHRCFPAATVIRQNLTGGHIMTLAGTRCGAPLCAVNHRGARFMRRYLLPFTLAAGKGSPGLHLFSFCRPSPSSTGRWV